MLNHKLRIRLNSGAEFEAEGPVEFILREKDSFLNRLKDSEKGRQTPSGQRQETGPGPAWEDLAETANGRTVLKHKHPGVTAEKAALLLLAAENQLNGSRETGALALSKALKASGYAPERLDRVLAKAVKNGLVKASGTKRNRTYQITDKGLETAWLEARKLNK